jgi:hypothetical protein
MAESNVAKWENIGRNRTSTWPLDLFSRIENFVPKFFETENFSTRKRPHFRDRQNFSSKKRLFHRSIFSINNPDEIKL